MIAIAVDDEKWALSDIDNALNKCTGIDEVNTFSDADEALEWASHNSFDIAFLDVHMRGIDGITLASKLRECNAKCYIIFCTGYNEYAYDAMKLHANGYVLKPVIAEKLQAEIDYITNWNTNEYLLSVRCYGGFEVYDKNGDSLSFKRNRSKELLALLIDHQGMSISSREICTYLWIDDGDMDQKNMAYLRQLFADLKQALNKVGANEVLKKNNNYYSVDMKSIKLLDTEEDKLNSYMQGYDWFI